MKLHLVFALMFLNSVTISAQDSLPKKKIFYKLELQEIPNKYKYGYLINITDDAIFYSSEKQRFGTPLQSMDKNIKYNNVAKLKIKRKDAGGRTALVGGGIGLGLGVIAGFIEGDDPEGTFLRFSAGDKAVFYGGALGIGGSLIGVIIGSVARKTFIIGGNREKHKAMKLNILQKAYGVQ